MTIIKENFTIGTCPGLKRSVTRPTDNSSTCPCRRAMLCVQLYRTLSRPISILYFVLLLRVLAVLH